MRSLVSLAMLMLLFAGCSTTASFKIPDGTKLIVKDIPVPDAEVLEYRRTPFFWDVTPGIPYRLEKDGQVVGEGKLKSHFRVASIFWPPFALIYWSMRFDGPYDLTVANAKVKAEKLPDHEVKVEEKKVEVKKKRNVKNSNYKVTFKNGDDFKSSPFLSSSHILFFERAV